MILKLENLRQRCNITAFMFVVKTDSDLSFDPFYYVDEDSSKFLEGILGYQCDKLVSKYEIAIMHGREGTQMQCFFVTFTDTSCSCRTHEANY